MNSATPTKPSPVPTILVYGTPASPDLTQASWFRAEDKQAAKAAAEALKFSVIDIQTDAEKALTVGVPEGVLKGSGRMVVGSVSTEVYRRIEEYVRKTSGADPSSKPGSPAPAAAKATPEQTTNTPAASEAKPAETATSKPVPVSPTQAWENLRAGDRVLVAYWNVEKEPEGWWPAIVARVEKKEFVLNWPDAPQHPAIKRAPKHVAILHPEFIASGE